MTDADRDTQQTSDKPGWRCPGCGEPLRGSFQTCWNCGTMRDGEIDPTFKPAVAPTEPKEHCQVCGYSLKHLTKPVCPECGTRFDPEFRDTPQDPPDEHSIKLANKRRFYMWAWVASWTIIPVLLLCIGALLSLMITDETIGFATAFILLLIGLALAVASPVLFFFNLLPDQPSDER